METTPLQLLELQRTQIAAKLKSAKFPPGKKSGVIWEIGCSLGVTGNTVENYLKGDKVPDGFLAIAIYKELKKLKFIKWK